MATPIIAPPRSPSTDESGLARAAPTDGEAFAELYRRHVEHVYRYHMAHTGNQKDAEDLTSQTFMAALEGIRSFRGDGSFAAWLMGIASRKRALFFRGRKPQVSLDILPDIPDSDPPTHEAAEQKIQLASVARALGQISPERAEAIILVAFAGLSRREAAGVLKKSEAALKMLVSRGLQELRQRSSLSLEVAI